MPQFPQPEKMFRPSYLSGLRDAESLLADAKQKQVIEYLLKKGYNRTEQVLRQESANTDKDGKPIHERAEDLGTQKYATGFRLLTHWIDQNLDIYKVSFVHKSIKISLPPRKAMAKSR